MGERVRMEWLATDCGEVRQVLGRGRVEHRAQSGMDWQDKLLAGLALPDVQQSVPQVLAPMSMTSARRCAVYSNSASASRARVPIGCLASKASMSVSAHE